MNLIQWVKNKIWRLEGDVSGEPGEWNRRVVVDIDMSTCLKLSIDK